MANKIKDIFSDDMFNINGTLRFSDDEAYKNFLAAMEIAYAEGRVVQVEGVTSVATTVGHLGAKFPLEEYTNITQFFVGPAVEPVPITLDVGGEKRTITLLRSRTKDKIIFQSGAGIVADSINEDEYLEVHNKLAANIATLKDLL